MFSDCGTYRYSLTRNLPLIVRWIKPAIFIMLNPSTADAQNDDPTIRRCISFAMREQCSTLTIVNLFALRATDPRVLKNHPDPIGPRNDEVIAELLRHNNASIRVAAWGSHPFARERGRQLLSKHGPLICLGTTKDGSPRHPLYVKADQCFYETGLV